MDLIIRRAELTDAEVLADLAHSTFEEAFKHRSTPTAYQNYVSQAFNVERIKIEIQEPLTDYFMAYHNHVPIAYMRLRRDRPRPDLSQAQLEMQRLYVSKLYWHQRVGTRLLEYATRLLAADGGGWLWLVVWSENHEAISFYKKHGFEHFAWYDFDFGSEIHHDPVMRLWVPGDLR